MQNNGKQFVVSVLVLAFLVLACRGSKELHTNANTATSNVNSNTESSNSNGSSSSDGFVSSGTGVEKEKPAADKANVQGRVFYNGQPAPSIDVKLCEKFNQYFGGCSGETFTGKSDANGEYLLKGVTPRVYEGLLVKVFNTPYYVFATANFVQTAKYQIDAGKTFFAPDTNLFKHDLKLENPKSGSKIDGSNVELKWDAYPDASYYKFSIYADSSSGAATDYDLISKRVDGVSYKVDKTVAPGAYTIKVEAYNASDIKLAQSADDIKFTVSGAAANK